MSFVLRLVSVVFVCCFGDCSGVRRGLFVARVCCLDEMGFRLVSDGCQMGVRWGVRDCEGVCGGCGIALADRRCQTVDGWRAKGGRRELDGCRSVFRDCDGVH